MALDTNRDMTGHVALPIGHSQYYTWVGQLIEKSKRIKDKEETSLKPDFKTECM